MSESVAAPVDACPSCRHALVDSGATCPECGESAEQREAFRASVGRGAARGAALLAMTLGAATAFGALCRIVVSFVPQYAPPPGTLAHWITSNLRDARQEGWSAAIASLVVASLLVRRRRDGIAVRIAFWAFVIVGVLSALSVVERQLAPQWREIVEIPRAVHVVVLAGDAILLAVAGATTLLAARALPRRAGRWLGAAAILCLLYGTSLAANAVLHDTIAWSQLASGQRPTALRIARPLSTVVMALGTQLPLALLVAAAVSADLARRRTLLVTIAVVGGFVAAAALARTLSPWLPIPPDLVPRTVLDPATLVVGVLAVVAGARLGRRAWRPA